MLKKIFITRHHGFCMGVRRAIKIAEETATLHTGKVTILNEIVHNEAVVNRFRQQGVGQTSSVDEVDEGTLIISAHGVSPAIKNKAEIRGLNIVDATCPLVERIYKIILKIIQNGYHVIHYGDVNHDETKGIVGHAPDHITVVGNKEELKALPEWQNRKLAMTVQTTAHGQVFAEIEQLALQKWPDLEIFNTICNATGQRQTAVMDLAPQVDMMLVVGSQTSANSKRLAQIADASCGRGVLIESSDDIQVKWFDKNSGIESVGVSAGTSTPEFLVDDVIERLVEISGGKATVFFPDHDQPRMDVMPSSE